MLQELSHYSNSITLLLSEVRALSIEFHGSIVVFRGAVHQAQILFSKMKLDGCEIHFVVNL